MKLKVTQRYYDKKEEIYVEKDSVIEREEERAKQLIMAGVASELQLEDNTGQSKESIGDKEPEKPKSARKKKTE